MAKPVEEMSFEEIEAERAEIRRQRAELNAERAPKTDDQVFEQRVVDAAEVVHAEESLDLPEQSEAEKAAVEDSWPHEHLSYMGLELDVRTPNQSALMAISMLQQLDGLAELQMDIFNTFLANHLSPKSLADVIKEMTRPDSELNMQGLVQALVNLRVNAA